MRSCLAPTTGPRTLQLTVNEQESKSISTTCRFGFLASSKILSCFGQNAIEIPSQNKF